MQNDLVVAHYNRYDLLWRREAALEDVPERVTLLVPISPDHGPAVYWHFEDEDTIYELKGSEDDLLTSSLNAKFGQGRWFLIRPGNLL
jgi:hypothetical protein